MPSTNNQVFFEKPTFEEFYNSITMFYVNEEYEKNIQFEIENKVDQLLLELNDFIGTKEGLKEYIINYPSSLDNLILILGVSSERFKRMVSMLRKEHGFTYVTEWGLPKIRESMIKNPKVMDSVIDLIYSGKDNSELKKVIPTFYLENMTIDKKTLEKISNVDYLRFVVKKSLEGRYSNNIGDMVIGNFETRLKDICIKKQLKYSKNTRIRELDRSVSFIVTSSNGSQIIIDISYFVTTTSAQTKRASDARKTTNFVKSERENGHNLSYILFVDGAGWLGRQSDLREIHSCSEYIINFKSINMLDEIINKCINKCD